LVNIRYFFNNILNGNVAYCCSIAQAVAHIFGYVDAKYTPEPASPVEDDLNMKMKTA